MKTVLTLDELQEKCTYWQEKLGLLHWRVSVEIKRGRDIPMKGCGGCNEFNIAIECASICILDPADYPDTLPLFAEDMETTLVHELLHITMRYFAAPEEHSLEDIHLEAAISRLARVLVGLRRDSLLDAQPQPA